MISNMDLEKTVLKGLLQHPYKWEEISTFLNDKDFYSEDSKVHISIFKLIRNALDNAEVIDETILIQRVNELKVSFPDSIDISEYIYSLAFQKINEDVFISSVKELKKFSARREIYLSCKDVASFVKKTDPNLKYSEIIDKADELYNKNIKQFEISDDGPVDLFEIMESVVEERGNNPIEEAGMMGPHQRINDIYGSLLLEGNISVIVARSGVGKTQFCMDYTTRAASKYDIPVLHFDNGEMSEEELIFRQCSAMTGIPIFLLQSGKWRSSSYGDWTAEEVVAKVRSAWGKIKSGKMRFYYENVAGMSADEMCSLLKRFYYSKVGRGNRMIFSFDYIKTDFNNLGKIDGWQQVASMVHKFKQTIHRDLCFDGKPCVSMMTSVQANRLGITGNRGADSIVDDESVVSLSDGITQFCSHLFLLRRKIPDEIHEEGNRFGTHKLINLKARHLGKDALRAINPVEMPDGSNKNNFINLEIENFKVTERGDLQDIVNSMNNQDVQVVSNDSETIPVVLTNVPF
jgi:replicative DNA helicase